MPTLRSQKKKRCSQEGSHLSSEKRSKQVKQHHRNPEERVLREKKEAEVREAHCYRDTQVGKGWE